MTRKPKHVQQPERGRKPWVPVLHLPVVPFVVRPVAPLLVKPIKESP